MFSILYDKEDYVVVQNDDTKKYSFGLKRDFGTLYGFPVNQSCLTMQEIKRQLKAFIKIDQKYLDSLGKYAEKNIQRWEDMIASVEAN